MKENSVFVNLSQGTVPLDFLDGDDMFKAGAIFTNARQILQQFEVEKRIL